MTEKEKRAQGLLYDANDNPESIPMKRGIIP